MNESEERMDQKEYSWKQKNRIKFYNLFIKLLKFGGRGL
jgi:hypothetical protein